MLYIYICTCMYIYKYIINIYILFKTVMFMPFLWIYLITYLFKKIISEPRHIDCSKSQNLTRRKTKKYIQLTNLEVIHGTFF